MLRYFNFVNLKIGSLCICKETSRLLFTSFSLAIKEIQEHKIDKQLVFEGVIKPDPYENKFLKTVFNPECCTVCSSNLDIKHTDVLILGQFVRSDGCMLPRRVTGLCKIQQKRISNMVAMAQKAGLMSELNPANSKKNPKIRRQWKKFNMYFDESSIKIPREYRKNMFSKYPKLF